jgi:DUF1680 family protein
LLAAQLIRPAVASAASSVEILQEFDLDQVTVTDPYYKNLFDKDVAYITSLDVDRLLAAFKAVSEGKDPGSAAGINLYGGWEGGWSLLRGHTIGHWLSAMARAYKQTKGVDQSLNDKITRKLDYAIAQLKTFQDKSSKGYLFGSPESHFDVVEGKASGSKWAPWYTMHKIITGLLDVHKYAGNGIALDVASKLGDWTYARSSTWDANLRTKVMTEEYGGMNDCLYDLYKLTQKPEHLTAAHTFDQDSLFTPISEGKDTLNGLHANTQIPKFIGAANRYRTVGASEKFYLTTAQQFWETVLKSHTYVTGGNSELEHFHEPGKLDARRNNVNNETCNSYNMLRLTRELFKITGDVKYADYYERAHINEILAAINPETAMTMYFKPMGTGYFKLFGSETETFWCCNGTGMENYVKLNDSLYFHDDKDLYVNAYVSSKLTWESRGLSLSLDTDLPLSEKVTVTVSAAPAEAAKIKFRKPYWVSSCGAVSVTVNGDSAGAVEESGYLAVSRTWKEGDKVELTFPLEVQVSRLPDNPNAVAFMYGPIVLSAGLGTEKMVSEPQWASAKATIPAGVVIQDTIAIKSGTINEWIADIRKNLVQTPGKLEFTLRNTDSDSKLKFTPHYQRYLDRYGIYFNLSGTTGGSAPAAACPPRDGGVDARPIVDAGADGVATGGNTATGGNGGNSTGGSGGGSSGGRGGGSSGGSAGNSMGGNGGVATGGKTGGAGGTKTGGAGAGGNGGGAITTSSGSSGCSCGLAASPRRESLLAPLGLLGLLIARRTWRRRR